MKKGLMLVALVSLMLTIIACGPRETRERTVAAVEDVRIIADVQRKSNDDAVGGAIIGGMIAGTKGAIIGAAAGSDPKVTVVTNLEGCTVTMRINNRRVRFFTQWGDSLTKCSLEFSGDKIWVEFVQHNLNFPEPHYDWFGIRGDILPD